MLTGPLLFPAHIDWADENVFFRKVDTGAFDLVPFHDGRYDFMDGPAVSMAFKTLYETAGQTDRPSPKRLMLHQSFCGSTYLARLLTIAQQTVSYREPQILIELADHAGKAVPDKLSGSLLERFAVGPDGILQAFVKPSNWPNAFLARASGLKNSRIVLIDMDLQAYLVANLRGGNNRIRYSLNLLNHVLSFTPEWSEAVEEAKSLLATSGLVATLRLLTILHIIQTQDFERIKERGDCHVTSVSHRDIQAMPLTSAVKAAKGLGLDITREALAKNLKIHEGQHAKSLLPDQFSLAKEAARNMDIINRYAGELDTAMRWADGTYDIGNGTH